MLIYVILDIRKQPSYITPLYRRAAQHLMYYLFFLPVRLPVSMDSDKSLEIVVISPRIALIDTAVCAGILIGLSSVGAVHQQSIGLFFGSDCTVVAQRKQKALCHKIGRAHV